MSLPLPLQEEIKNKRKTRQIKHAPVFALFFFFTVFLIFFIFIGQKEMKGPFLPLTAGPPAPAKQISRKECKELYKRQLHLADQKDFPLAPAMRLKKKYLQAKDARLAQLLDCRKNVSPAQYRCQMQAKDFYTLLGCRENRPFPQELKVNAKSCKKSYHTILQIVKKSKNFQKQRKQENLETYWNSQEARRSFQKRCLKRFTKQDLKCIQDAEKLDVLSGCLLAVPE